MPRIIVKCKYLKSGKHRSFYMKYMATRDGAELINLSYGKAEATAKQKKMIQSIFKDFPGVKDLFEYEDYLAEPNRENASNLISTVLEHNMEQIATKENYVDYIANRPRVEKLGEHGLFSDNDDIIDLNRTAQEVAMHTGYVWTNIISIKREDAERLGYDNAKAWKNLCRAKRNELAEAINIEPSNLKWYAAFHNEGHHPHIHMIVYSTNEKQGYLTKEGIDKIRSMYARTIFKQDLFNLYQEQTHDRDEVKRLSKEQIQKLINSLNEPNQKLDEMELLIKNLHAEIKKHKGKLVYGFLDRKTKQLVDEIMKLLEKDERVQKLYEEWYLEKEEIRHTYTDRKMMKIPFHMQKEFRSIKNMILKEVKNMSFEDIQDDEIKISIPEESKWMDDMIHSIENVAISSNGNDENKNDDYKKQVNLKYLLKQAEHGNDFAQFHYGRYLIEGEVLEKNVGEGIQWLEKSAKQNNMFAQCLLGKLFLYGNSVERDEERTLRYLKSSAQQGNKYAQWLLEHRNDYPHQPMLLLVSRFFHYIGKAFEKEMLPDRNNPLAGVDRKLKRKILEKRSALGHRDDDHSMNTQI